MGPWPVYIATTGLLALALLFVLQMLADAVGRGDRRRVPADDGLVEPIGAAQ